MGQNCPDLCSDLITDRFLLQDTPWIHGEELRTYVPTCLRAYVPTYLRVPTCLCTYEELILDMVCTYVRMYTRGSLFAVDSG